MLLMKAALQTPMSTFQSKGELTPEMLLTQIMVLHVVIGRNSLQKAVSMGVRYRQRRSTTHYSQSGLSCRSRSITTAHGQSYRMKF